ncbi:MAG: S8 family peptidase [Leptolyngbyaceae cyanobacterium MO_188.B28]|nr:S8 family peptidase [Leptolyngbyaceae cyanobacterium MO_188.B28]
MRRLLWIGLFFVGLAAAIAAFPGISNQGEFDSLLIDFNDNLTPTQIQTELRKVEHGNAFRLNSEFSGPERLYVVEGDRKLLKALRHSDLAKFTEHIEPNYIYTTRFRPNDPDYDKQWNLRDIGVESAWNITAGKDVTVAVIDTGVSRVPDLQKTQFVPGYDFVNDREQADDDFGHGTHVAGTIAQTTNNQYGVAGVAFEANLMPLKVLDETGAGTVSDIAEAIRFAADKDADVINLSLGGAGDSQVLAEAVEYAYRKGVVLIGAAGNEGRNSASYPARYPHVVAVAATGPSGAKAGYSNFGAGVDIAAPGGDIQQGDPSGGILQNTVNPATGESVFASFQGTSMAAPHVAGVAALIKAVGVDSPDNIVKILQASARTDQNDTLNHFGAGHLDAAAAVDMADKGQFNFRNFFRWLRENGYLNPKFWIDGGLIAFWPKVLMVLGSYLLAWLLRVYLPFAWGWALSSGLIMGSCGLFFLQGVYIFDLPQWPLRMMGSSIPELGSAIQGSPLLNPLFASVLIPLGLIALLLGHVRLRWFAIGSCLGVAACLAISAIADPGVMWIGQSLAARSFLAINALLCYGLAYLAAKSKVQPG